MGNYKELSRNEIRSIVPICAYDSPIPIYFTFDKNFDFENVKVSSKNYSIIKLYLMSLRKAELRSQWVIGLLILLNFIHSGIF